MNRLDLIVKLILEGGFLMILFSINNRVYFTCLFALFCQTTRKFSQVFKLFFKNIWIWVVNVLPLQALSGRNRVIDC